MKEATGTCLCGSVTVSFPMKEEIFDACHCGMCRKWGGGPGMTVAASGKPTFKGEEFITTYNSSDWAERGFCNKCGTHLFYRLKQSDFINFPLGLIKDNEKFEFHVQIYVDCKPDNYSFTNKTEMMTEAEVIAKFSGQ